MITLVGGDRVDRDDQVSPADPGRKLPRAVSARRAVLAGGGKGEPRPVPFPGTLPLGPGAARGDPGSPLVGDRPAPRGPRGPGGRGGPAPRPPRGGPAAPRGSPQP